MNPFFTLKGNVINGITHFSPREALDECRKGALLLDMRRDYEIAYKQFDVPEVIYARIDFIKEYYDELPKDVPLIIADHAGVHSREITEFLAEKGFKNVANLAGGIFEWDRDGLPLKIDNDSMLSGQCLCVLRTKKKKNE